MFDEHERDQRLPSEVTDLVSDAERSTPEFNAAVEAIMELQKTAKSLTVFDLLGSAYGRRPPKGKTLHIVEHTMSLGGKRVSPRGTRSRTSRMKGAPSVVVSRILYPVASDDSRGDPWRRSGDALVLDGCDHRAIRARLDLLVETLKAGEVFEGPPLGLGPMSRVGALDIEARNRFQLTLESLNWAREIRWWEDCKPIRGAIDIPISDQLNRPIVGMHVVAVHRTTRRKWPTTSNSEGLAVFRDLPPGSYSVRALAADGRVLIAAVAEPRDYELRTPYFTPIPESTGFCQYRELHRTARARRRRPSKMEATKWLTSFLSELLKQDDRRSALLDVVRDDVSTGRGRLRPAYNTSRALAAALTAAFLDRTPSAIRKAIAPEPDSPRA